MTAAIVRVVPTHTCMVCRDLPERPFDRADVDPNQDYRPRKPAVIVSGKTARSFRCRRHERDRVKARGVQQRATHKERRFGLSPELQQELWEFQGCCCPCGRKRAPLVPSGVTLDHDRALAQLHDHPDENGCPGCVRGYLCPSCNRDIVGRLERAYRDNGKVIEALQGIASHLTDPPLRRLLALREMGDTA